MSSPNRTYIADLNGGDRVQVLWVDGVQRCTLIPKGEKHEEKTLRDYKVKKAVDLSTIRGDRAEKVLRRELKKDDYVAPQGKPQKFTWQQLRAAVLAGSHVYNKRGRKIPCTKKAEANPKGIVMAIEVKQGKQIQFHITK